MTPFLDTLLHLQLAVQESTGSKHASLTLGNPETITYNTEDKALFPNSSPECVTLAGMAAAAGPLCRQL